MTADQITLRDAIKLIEAEKELRRLRIDAHKKKRARMQQLRQRQRLLNKKK